jgi:hypothetical protein
MGMLYILLSLRDPLPTFVFLTESAEAAAVISGIFMWFAVLSVLDIRRFTSDLGRINKGSLLNDEHLIVSGSFKPMTDLLLRAPFSGRECVGYYYEITHTTRGPKSRITKWTDYEGYALIPAVIESPLGSLKVLAEPNKELFYEVPFVKPNINWQDVETFLKTRDFGENVKGPGDFSVHKKSGDSPDLTKCDFDEKFIQSGETVLAEGIYRSDKMGIAPDPNSIMRPFHLVPGGENTLEKKKRNRITGAAVSTGLCCVTIAIYFFFLAKG